MAKPSAKVFSWVSGGPLVGWQGNQFEERALGQRGRLLTQTIDDGRGGGMQGLRVHWAPPI